MYHLSFEITLTIDFLILNAIFSKYQNKYLFAMHMQILMLWCLNSLKLAFQKYIL